MRLYSIQPLSVWESLCLEEVITAKPVFDKDDQQWEIAYSWLAEQMIARGIDALGNAPPSYPMWAWYWYNGPSSAKPDLRHSQMKQWSSKERMVMLTLEMDDKRVLLSDYDAWHACLNYWYLGFVKDTNNFSRRLKRELNTNYYQTKPLPGVYDQQLKDSWNQIFNLAHVSKILHSKHEAQIVQATFWQLTRQDVIIATEFGLGKKLNRLLY